MSIPAYELESMKETFAKALSFIDTLSKHQPAIKTMQDEKPVEEVLTIPQLMRRLKIGKESMYDILAEPGCPVFTLGGPRQQRVIWSEFVQWLKERDVS
ncbi:hypothetical protein M5X00_32060 [Paenibacillus alvei]|uniref:Helix-turn-helix domain-containing protein n=1 Tax=Paenibacillus alvei TaxID=44250 RepID=A0ABT4GXR4_PAEAL|nr:hypothetical protein [Paenibacillus alvei]MCY9541816.1 hypothetical protein [Paenibacillus alvei]MCY9704996.1 hypothetical protein [Paenibacillus alvei]MCY9734673.1 hypothetical protein [Paenibacillus alvei]MCY9758853.1 hypothetical protein [Paenibacillus alvei]MCY9761202.1 hypothetical protein [Paenibacillus alvei]